MANNTTSIWAKVFGVKGINEDSSAVEIDQAAEEILQEKDATIASLTKQLEDLQAETANQVVEETLQVETDNQEDNEVIVEQVASEANSVQSDELIALASNYASLASRVDTLDQSVIEQGIKIEDLTAQLSESNVALANLKAKGVQSAEPMGASSTERLAESIDQVTAAGGVKIASGTINPGKRPA